MIQNTNSPLLQLFDRYDQAVDYDLNTVAEFQATPLDLRPLYTVNDLVKCEALTLQTSSEPFVEIESSARANNVTIKCQAGITDYGSASGALHLRHAAAVRLCQAAQRLQALTADQYYLLLTDAYRPLVLQRQHFEKIKGILAERGYTGAELYKLTTQLIADPDVLPPHTTGGTVDVTLWDAQRQQPAWLGTSVDAIDTKLIHTWHPDVGQPERKLRALLYQVMTEAGFINHPLEWWHYSYGDTEWALHTGQLATLYNAVEQLPPA